ncbi:MAG: hypothetical protein AAFX40_11400 [Cyanobacteria bacterium J06639_1]
MAASTSSSVVVVIRTILLQVELESDRPFTSVFTDPDFSLVG